MSEAVHHAAEDDVFQLDSYLRSSKKLDLSSVRWEDVRKHPVSQEELRCLTYMMDIESHTVVFLRDLLATRTTEEPDITAFLSCWVYEEFWHGEAFSRFIGETGYASAPDFEVTKGGSPLPSKIRRNQYIRSQPGGRGFGSFLITIFGSMISADFPALHMTWGALNELSVLTGYRRLMAKSQNPVLKELLGQIMKDEARHYSFYRMQAESRLKRSAMARRLTRWALKNVWAPVGSGVRPREETDFVASYLFGDDEGRKAGERIDEKINLLPGLEGCRLFMDAIDAATGRIGPVYERRTPFQAAMASA